MRRVVVIALFTLFVGAALAVAADRPTLVGVGGGGGGTVPAPEFAVLLDQPLSAVDTNAYANQDFEVDFDAYDIYIADDFTVPAAGWQIQALFVTNNAWNPGNGLECVDMLHFEIYADAAGQPAGYPGGTAPLWSLAVPPADSQITLSAGTGGWNTNALATLTTPVDLAAGTYWLLFYPSAGFSACGQYGRQVADTANGGAAMVINPGAGFGYPTVWTSVQDASTWALTTQDMSMRIEGVILPVELQSFDAE
jgi:hypothetical protein